jgi:hypothetical protein
LELLPRDAVFSCYSIISNGTDYIFILPEVGRSWRIMTAINLSFDRNCHLLINEEVVTGIQAVCISSPAR